MGGGKNEPPSPPDYSAVAQGQVESAEIMAQVQREQLAWAKDQYAQNQEVTNKVVDQALRTSEEQAAYAREEQQRYRERFQPLENDLIKEYQDYNTDAKFEQEAGRASAAVASQFDAARQAAMRDLESYGVDPSQTRAGALDLGTRIAQGAVTAGAENIARDNVLNTRRALRSEAINIGKGYGSQVASAYGISLAAGNQAVNAGLATTAGGTAAMGSPVQWGALQQQNYQGILALMNQDYQTRLKQYEYQKQNSSGIASGVGTVLGGIVGAYFGGPGGAMAGGAMGNAMGGAIDKGFVEGGRVTRPQAAIPGPGAGPPMAVTPQMSPSRGAAIDDVAIRANEGEIVVPEDVARWYGEKFFHDMAIKARKSRGDENPRGLGPPGGRPMAVPMGA